MIARVAALHACHGRLEPLARHSRVGDAGSRQIEANAAHPRLPHSVEGTLRRLVINDGDAARVGSTRLHAIERGGVIGAVDTGGDDHHALDMERLVERRHLLGQRHLRRVGAPRKEGKTCGITVDVRVAIAGAGRHVEVDRRGRLGRGGSARAGT